MFEDCHDSSSVCRYFLDLARILQHQCTYHLGKNHCLMFGRRLPNSLNSVVRVFQKPSQNKVLHDSTATALGPMSSFSTRRFLLLLNIIRCASPLWHTASVCTTHERRVNEFRQHHAIPASRDAHWRTFLAQTKRESWSETAASNCCGAAFWFEVPGGHCF